MDVVWQRFNHVMQLHINSVAEIDTHKLHSLDVRPHYVKANYKEKMNVSLIFLIKKNSSK